MRESPFHTPFRNDGLPVVVVTGFMGTGKTETARALAGLLGLEFLDTDQLIEKRLRMSIAEVFDGKGEAYFRSLEEKICDEIQGRSGLVVSTGGGTILSEKNFRALSNLGRLVLLTASSEKILERVGKDRSRPLLRAGASEDLNASRLRDRIDRTLKSREASYERVSSRIDTTCLSPHQAACRIAASLEIPFRVIAVRVPGAAPIRAAGVQSPNRAKGPDELRRLGPGVTSVVIGRGVLSKLGERLSAADLRSKAFVFMPEGIRDIFLEQISSSLESVSLPWQEIPVRDGDAEKNLDQICELMDKLSSLGAERSSVAVAVGGGVTGDLAGFAASIYMRGISLVHVPTTLLAQVDSSIGGKVGVNHPSAKNLIGSFYQPHLVVSDPCALRTLSDRDISNGMAEVIKTAIIGSPELFELIECEISRDSSPGCGEGPSPKLRDIGFLERCVAECATVKTRIVERDPFERGERRTLNLGHTVGHALEASGGYKALTHGEAVSIGLMAALRIAERRGRITGDLLFRTRRMLVRCGLPVDAPATDQDVLLEKLALDKKRLSGRLHFVLPAGIGSVLLADDVTEDEIRDSLQGEIT